MKNPPPSRPRFYCRLVRLRSPDATTGLAGRHVAGCADCREFFRAATALESALRRDAVRCAAPAPTDLERRIVQAIRAATPAPAPVASRGWFGVAGTAVAAMAALVVVFLHQPKTTPETGLPVPSVPESIALGKSITDLVNDVVTTLPGAVAPENPLQNELTSVYSDARSALDFLALNFLPSPALRDDVRMSDQMGAKG